MIVKEAKTEAGFRGIWLELERESRLPGRGVMEGHLFTHASKGDQEDGLEFSRQGADGTMNKQEMTSLPRLNWEHDCILVLHGCNTGLKGTRGWAPAAELARAQGVKTLGQAGYAYFSTDRATFREMDSGSGNVHLWAYRKGRNGIIGNGARMEAIEY